MTGEWTCSRCGEVSGPDHLTCPKCGFDPNMSDHSTEMLSLSNPILCSFAPVASGQILNQRFRIIKLLGSGGMGHIYLAEDTKLKRKVAIKCISDSKIHDPQTKARFLREAQVISQLEHSNICPIYEIFEENGNDYFVMQYINGATLAQVTCAGPLSLAKILDISLQTCEAMAEAHDKNIIHRDIKPGNIMIDRRGVVKILDFGLAKTRSKSFEPDPSGAKPTEQGVVLGTVPYMSPEQARGEELDDRSDIFSFGSVLYECIEGRHPFAGTEQIETLYNILHKTPEYSPHILPELKNILQKTLAKNKEDRFQSFIGLRDALLTFKTSLDQKSVTTPAESIAYRKDDPNANKSTSENLSGLVKKLGEPSSLSGVILPAPFKWTRLLAVLVLLICVTGYFILSHRQTPVQEIPEPSIKLIFLNKFTNETQDPDTAEIIQLLLAESLNQYDSIKVVMQSDLSNGKGQGSKQSKIIQSKIKYGIQGRITHQGTYSIDAELIPIGDPKKARHIPITGSGADSFLEHQIDYISSQVFTIVMGHKPENPKKITNEYGSSWKDVATFSKGLKHFARLENEVAIRHFQSVEHIPASRYYLGELYYFNGDRAHAKDEINILLPLLDSFTPGMRLKVLALKARIEFDFKGQRKYLEELKNLSPLSRDVFYQLGEAYFHMGQAESAREYYLKALELDPKFSKAINHLGYCNSYLGNHEEAITRFQEYRRYDLTANAYDSLGDGFFFAGNLELAYQFKNAAIQQDKLNVPWAFLTIADIYILEARFHDAQETLDQYLQCVSPEHKNLSAEATVKTKRAFIGYLNRNDSENRENALKLIDESLNLYDSSEINNDSAEAHWIRGLLNISNPREDLEWLHSFSKKYKLTADNFSPPLKFFLHLQALNFERSGEIEKAKQSFEKLLSMKPQLSYWITYYNYSFFQTRYASFLFRNKEYKACEMELDKCFSFNPDYPPALWLSYDLNIATGKPGSREILQKIQTIYGSSQDMNSRRKRLMKLLN